MCSKYLVAPLKEQISQFIYNCVFCKGKGIKILGTKIIEKGGKKKKGTHFKCNQCKEAFLAFWDAENILVIETSKGLTYRCRLWTERIQQKLMDRINKSAPEHFPRKHPKFQTDSFRFRCLGYGNWGYMYEVVYEDEKIILGHIMACTYKNKTQYGYYPNSCKSLSFEMIEDLQYFLNQLKEIRKKHG